MKTSKIVKCCIDCVEAEIAEKEKDNWEVATVSVSSSDRGSITEALILFQKQKNS